MLILLILWVISVSLLIAILHQKEIQQMGIVQSKIDELTAVAVKVGNEVTSSTATFQSAIAGLEAQIAELIANGSVDTTALEAALAALDAINVDEAPPAE